MIQKALIVVAKSLYFGGFAVPVSLVITASGIAALVNYYISQRKLKFPPPPGKTITLDIQYPEEFFEDANLDSNQLKSVQQFYYHLTQPSSNIARNYLFVLEAGSTFSSGTWFHVQSKLEKLGIPSLSYDRVGYGYSTYPYGLEDNGFCELQRTPKLVSYELSQLLQELDINSKYDGIIVCGHSLGAVFIRSFLVHYSAKFNVKAAILADGMHKLIFDGIGDNFYENGLIQKFKYVRYLLATGFPRMITLMPFFWKFFLWSAKSKNDHSIVEQMNMEERELFKKDTSSIIDNILTSSMWLSAEKESLGYLKAMNSDSDKLPTNIPVHSYVAGLFELSFTIKHTAEELKKIWLRQQETIFQQYNSTGSGSFHVDEKVDHLNILFAKSFFEFLVNLYAEIEEYDV
jgi:pimeloyl-ACP methyl ester carboxylesterase